MVYSAYNLQEHGISAKGVALYSFSAFFLVLYTGCTWYFDPLRKNGLLPPNIVVGTRPSFSNHPQSNRSSFEISLGVKTEACARGGQ